MPTPDASWAPESVANFAQGVELLDVARLLVALEVLGFALVVFLLAIPAIGAVLRRGG